MPNSKTPAAFTLVELLVVLAIVLVLGALASGVLVGARKKADQTASISNLRHFGNAIQLYAGDHDARLPGPLWPGQVAEFDATRPGRLVVDLADYLGLEDAQGVFLAEQFLSPAFKRAMPKERWHLGRMYVANMAVPVDPDDPASGNFAPWGNRAVSETAEARKILEIKNPASRWALSEADQTHPNVAAAAWRADTPPTPIHGNRRATLYFDGHVDMVPIP